jgi:ABC-2 type transport system permease protein
MTAVDAPLGGSLASTRPPRRAWWLLFQQEIAELWLGGKALTLLIVFSLLMSLTAFLVATNSELSLTPPRLMIIIMLQAATSFGIFIGLTIASESFSGERERATFEALLLSPASRRQIVAGKYLAALSPWPVAFLLAIPYILVLSQGDLALVPALVWGAALGTMVVVFFTGIGLLVSMWSDHSRTSLFVSLMVYLVALLPEQLPGEFQTTPLGALLQLTIPLEALRQFMLRGFVEVRLIEELWPLLYAPIALTALVLGIVFLYAAPRLRLEATGTGWLRSVARRTEGVG